MLHCGPTNGIRQGWHAQAAHALQECWRVSGRLHLTRDAAVAHVHARFAAHPPLLRTDSLLLCSMLLANSLKGCCAASQISS